MSEAATLDRAEKLMAEGLLEEAVALTEGLVAKIGRAHV